MLAAPRAHGVYQLGQSATDEPAAVRRRLGSLSSLLQRPIFACAT